MLKSGESGGSGGNDGEVGKPDRPGTPDVLCAICIDTIVNKCHTEECRHLFCYECLKRWSTVHPSCPLCKRQFVTIRYSFTSEGSYETYDILNNSDGVEPNGNGPDGHGTDGQGGGILMMQQTIRQYMYERNSWTPPTVDQNGRIGRVNPIFFRENPLRALRLREFIRIDVSALMDIQRNSGRWNGFMESMDVEALTNLIIRSVSMYEIMSDGMKNILRTYLGRYTEQFCYELYTYANSTVTNDQQLNQGDDNRENDVPEFEMAFNYGNILESDMDNEESAENRLRQSLLETSMVIDESDEAMFRSFLVSIGDTVGSSFSDQPSTSMGTRLSSEPPNDSTSDQNTSSEETTIGFWSSSEESETSEYEEPVRGKRKRRIETNNSNKRLKKSNDGQPNIRRQWYDDSPSSSDTD